MGKSAAKVQAVQDRVQINDLKKEETCNFVPFIFSGSSDPFALLTPVLS